MGASQRNKGAAGEREVLKIFSDALGGVFKRKIGQARDGGNDGDVGKLCVEVKRRKTLGTVMSWLHQAEEAIGTPVEAMLSDRIPLVVAREDNGPWIVIIALEDFLVLSKDEIIRRGL
jgi:hypothetical protein